MRRGSNDQYEKYAHVRPVSGTYEKKVSIYLRFDQASFVYGLFRTEKLQNRMVSADQAGWDLLLIFNICFPLIGVIKFKVGTTIFIT